MHIKKFLFLVVASLAVSSAYAQHTDAVSGATQHTDAVSGATQHSDENHKARSRRSFASRLTLGGYGEATAKYAFYSNNYLRYQTPEDYKNDRFGQFDLPHVVLNLGFDFGRGWSMGTEIEFEHGGTESAVEIEEEEGGEYETEVERGGEIALEQFWLQKHFNDYANIRAGMIIVPVGGTNAHHEPNQFFGVFRPEGDNTILPCTWHDIGLQFHGRYKWIGYTAQFLPGLESGQFGNKSWIHYGSASAYEFKLANCFAGAARLDFYPLKKGEKDNLRISLSGYCGSSFRNYLLKDLDGVISNPESKYYGVKGLVTIGSLDWCYNDHHMIFRGSATYGHLDDADKITSFNLAMPQSSVSKRQVVGSVAYSVGVEYGYDFFHFNKKLADHDQRFFLFGRYDIYDSQADVDGGYNRSYWCGRQKFTVGINYFPMKQIAIKAEYAYGLMNRNPNQIQNTDGTTSSIVYNNEPYIALGITYCGMFLGGK